MTANRIPPTSKEAMDRAVAKLNDRKRVFAALDVPARLILLQRMSNDTLAAAEDQVRAACKAKGIDPNTPPAAEEWLGGPMTILRNLRLLQKSLQEIIQYGRPQLHLDAVRIHDNGQVIARVFPDGLDDKLLFTGFTSEVWMDPELKPHELAGTMAKIYQPSAVADDGAVALVLGAGNVASIGPMDVLYKLFTENQVCVLKMNPVNEYLGPFVERGFRAAIEAGFLRVVYGGAAEGAYLVEHEGVDEIHITGSSHVHDIIVWGPPGAEQARRKAAGEAQVTKRITSELGCVTPVIIVPGEWTARELVFQAQNVATMLANNASFNCNAAKLLVTSAGWSQREAFLEQLRRTLEQISPRQAYYPGADERFERFIDAYPQAIQIGHRSSDALPWAFIPEVDPASDALAFTTEAWCSVLSETALKESDPAAFMDAAVKFCNERVWGTLSCSLLIDPRTQKAIPHDLERAVTDLRYGSVVVNHWPGLSYGLVVNTWGAYPGHTLEDIGSGIGVVHNTMMFERPQKTVIQGPFLVNPKPPWFATHRRSHLVAPRLTQYEHSPSKLKIPGIAINALLG